MIGLQRQRIIRLQRILFPTRVLCKRIRMLSASPNSASTTNATVNIKAKKSQPVHMNRESFQVLHNQVNRNTGGVEDADALFSFLELQSLGYKPTVDAYYRLVESYGGFANRELMEGIVREMIDAKMPLNLPICQRLISMYMKNGMAGDALRLLHKVANVEPNLLAVLEKGSSNRETASSQKFRTSKLHDPVMVSLILSSIMEGFYNLKDPQQGHFFYQVILALGLKPNDMAFASAINCHSTLSNELDVFKWWDAMTVARIPISQEAYLLTANALARFKSPTFEIDRLMQQMLSDGSELAHSTLLAFMHAYYRAGSTDVVINLFNFLIKTTDAPTRRNLPYMTAYPANIPFILYLEVCRHVFKHNGADPARVARVLYSTAHHMLSNGYVLSQVSWAKLRATFFRLGHYELYLNLLYQGLKNAPANLPRYPKKDALVRRPRLDMFDAITDSIKPEHQHLPPSSDPNKLFGLHHTHLHLRRVEDPDYKFLTLFFYIVRMHLRKNCRTFDPLRAFKIKLHNQLKRKGKQLGAVDDTSIVKWSHGVFNQYIIRKYSVSNLALQSSKFVRSVCQTFSKNKRLRTQMA
jgi:hypothetical protein